MPTIVVAILCIALVVVGGLTMSQGIMASADTTAQGFEEISVIEGEIMRTGITTARGADLSWADTVRLTIENEGQTRLAGYDKWDMFVQYYDNGGSYHTNRLAYTTDAPGDNEWQAAALCLNGAPEVFEPYLLNPGEEIIILARLNPAPANGAEVNVTMATGNGVQAPFSFTRYSYTLLHPHAETFNFSSDYYYEMAEAAPSDGPATTLTTDIYEKLDTGRRLMHDEENESLESRFLFPLTGISHVQAAAWTIYYRCRTDGDGFDRNDNAHFNIDIIVRKSDGTLRTTIATDVADTSLRWMPVGQWMTRTGSYNFPGYDVVNETDYLEIDFYGELSSVMGSNNPNYLKLMIDNDSLDTSLQTRIEES